MLLGSAVLLGVFYIIDRRVWARDGGPRRVGPPRIGFRELHNLIDLVATVGAVLLSGLWKPGVALHIWRVDVPLEGLFRDGLLSGLAGLSWATTAR